MLVLSRKLNESIIIDGTIRITIVGIRSHHVRVGIEAPDSIPIIREELCERLAAEESRAPAAREGLGSGLASGHPA